MKEEIRKKYLNIRNNIYNRNQLNDDIFNEVINNLHILNCDLILIYVSFGSEVDTIKLIEYLLKHKKVAVPKIINDKMEFYYIKSLNELKIGKFKILEPITNHKVTNFNSCVSITPGICFSKDLYRIGYGKGYYDKFYQDKDTIYKIGLTYDECIIDTISKNNYDIQLDEIISPTKNIKKTI